MVNEDKEFATAAGYEVRPDPDQAGLFVWRSDGDGCDQSFTTEEAAWTDAAFNAASAVMGYHDLDSEEWDVGSHDAHVQLAKEMTGVSPSP